jgi:TRAP-type C4-dicarboxylate transport system permease small subunit
MAKKKTKAEELLEKISKTLEDISKGFDATKNGERRLQIDIAKLQADIQIWLTLCVGFVAICGALLIGAWQLYITPVSSDMVLLKIVGYITLGFVLIGAGGLAIFSAKKMDSYRNALNKL